MRTTVVALWEGKNNNNKNPTYLFKRDNNIRRYLYGGIIDFCQNQVIVSDACGTQWIRYAFIAGPVIDYVFRRKGLRARHITTVTLTCLQNETPLVRTQRVRYDLLKSKAEQIATAFWPTKDVPAVIDNRSKIKTNRSDFRHDSYGRGGYLWTSAR